MTSGQSTISSTPSETRRTLHGMAKSRGAGTLTAEQAKYLQRNLRQFRAEFAEATGEPFTAEETAELAHMSIDTYRGYENGTRSPRAGSLAGLAKFFQRPMEDFI